MLWPKPEYSHTAVATDWSAQQSGVTSTLAGPNMTILADYSLASRDTVSSGKEALLQQFLTALFITGGLII